MEPDVANGAAPDYDLSENVGYLLRRCFQINSSEFVRAAPPELSPPRFAALARLVEHDVVSQNRLGRLTSTDGATIKGIVDRLGAIGAVTVSPDPADKRQRLVSITERGRELHRAGVAASLASSDALLQHLAAEEAALLIGLLRKAADGAASTGQT